MGIASIGEGRKHAAKDFLLAHAKWPTGTGTDSFGFLLQTLARRMDEMLKKHLKTIDLDNRFFPSLIMLLAQDGRSQKELGQCFDVPEYQTSRNIDALEAKGLVTRCPCPISRRRTLVHLTEEGRELANKLPDLVKAANAEFLECLAEEEQEFAVTLLQKVYDHTANS